MLSKLRKKRGSAVTIDGDTFYVRALTLGELRRVDALPPDLKTGFVVGCTLCSGLEGEPEFPKLSDEDDRQWAQRVTDELADVPTDTIRSLSESVSKLGQTPKAADVVKN